MAKSNSGATRIDAKLPALAKAATGLAHRQARRSGTVLVYRNGELRRIEPSGEDHLVKKLEPRVRVPKGTIFEIKPQEA